MVKAKVWQLARRPKGEPVIEDFQCVEETLPPCKDGDVVVTAETLSVDPYMRVFLADLPLKGTMVGEQVARVTESKNPEWPVGSFMLISCGWRTHTHLTPADLRDEVKAVQRLPDLGKLPKSLGLGILGMPGNTAYLSFLEVMRPKPGETVLVNGAAGAVGSTVVQLAKMAGCKVVAFAGTDDKVQWVKELGADHAFNYKTVKVGEALTKAAPEKVNIYFDNVGGKFSSEVLPHIAVKGRILACGAISTYNKEGDASAPALTSPFTESVIVLNEITIQGFLIFRWRHRWEESFAQMKKWVEKGKLKYHESRVQGFNNMPTAFLGIFRGSKSGKVVVMP